MNKDITQQSKRVAKAVLYIMIASFAGLVAREAVNSIYPKSSIPAYDQTTLDRVVGDERFSVRLSSGAVADDAIMAESQKLRDQGFDVNGVVYRDLLFDQYAMVKAGCLDYLHYGQPIDIATEEAIGTGFNDEKSDWSARGYDVTETSRNYSRGDSGSTVGVLDINLKKDGKSNALRVRIVARGNRMCIIGVAAPPKLLEPLYSDLVASFQHKW